MGAAMSIPAHNHPELSPRNRTALRDPVLRVPTKNHFKTGNIEVPFENKKFEQKPNGGSLFRNKSKKDAKSPEYGGSAVINGVEFKVSAWINETGGGERYMRLSFAEKRND
jgi:hypothetical protein